MREPLSLPHDPAAAAELLAWAHGEAGHCLCAGDLRGADLRGIRFGPGGPGGCAGLVATHLHDCRVAGDGGWVRGTADVGPAGRPRVLGGAELAAWFAGHGAPDVEVAEG